MEKITIFQYYLPSTVRIHLFGSFFLYFLLFFVAHLTSKSNILHEIPFTTLYTNFKSIEPWDFKQKLFHIKVQHYSVSSLVYQKLHFYNSPTFHIIFYSTQYTPFTVLQKIYIIQPTPVSIKEILLWWMSWFICRRRCFSGFFFFGMNKNRIILYTFQAGCLLLFIDNKIFRWAEFCGIIIREYYL